MKEAQYLLGSCRTQDYGVILANEDLVLQSGSKKSQSQVRAAKRKDADFDADAHAMEVLWK